MTNDTDLDEKYAEYDDEYDCAPVRARLNTCRSKPMINNRMATLNRQAGIINRYRNQGILK